MKIMLQWGGGEYSCQRSFEECSTSQLYRVPPCCETDFVRLQVCSWWSCRILINQAKALSNPILASHSCTFKNELKYFKQMLDPSHFIPTYFSVYLKNITYTFLHIHNILVCIF